ncbi:MAG: GNAT family N-acetyltransferase [Burkholderiales bacterium]
MARLREASAPGDVDAVRSLFAEYARSVDEPCCFAGFERELAELPRGFRALYIADDDGVAAGCVGLREVDRGTAEMKRLYVRSAWRGRGLGRALAQAAIEAARSAGYARIVLDSLPKMHEARALYRSLDFRETAPYLAQPTPGADCFERRL